jgi:hypothetical protein
MPIRHRAALASALLALSIPAFATALAAPARAQEGEGLSVHGYLTQAYAWTDSLPILGITDGGTSDYRAAALQFRYGIAAADEFIVQLSHRRLGESILNGATSDVALDWAFYARRVGPLAIRVGRVPTPRGIYNETRDVGTVLPFYRAPYSFYTESFETTDGASVSWRHPLPGRFALEGSVYGGGLDFKQISTISPEGPSLLDLRAERQLGTQLWLHTPLRGVRVGASAMRFTLDHNISPAHPGRAASVVWGASLDATRDRGFLRGEIGQLTMDGMRFDTWWAQAGVRVAGRLGINAQTESADNRLEVPTLGELRYDYARDHAIGLSFDVTPGFVLKLEGHRAKGYNLDTYSSPLAAPKRADYAISSVSVSF